MNSRTGKGGVHEAIRTLEDSHGRLDPAKINFERMDRARAGVLESLRAIEKAASSGEISTGSAIIAQSAVDSAKIALDALESAEGRLADAYTLGRERDERTDSKRILQEIARSSRREIKESLRHMKHAVEGLEIPEGAEAPGKTRKGPSRRTRPDMAELAAGAMVAAIFTAAIVLMAGYEINGPHRAAEQAIQEGREPLVREVIAETAREMELGPGETDTLQQGARTGRMDTWECRPAEPPGPPDQGDRQVRSERLYVEVQECHSTLWTGKPERMKVSFSHIVELKRTDNPFRKPEVVGIRPGPDAPEVSVLQKARAAQPDGERR